MRTSSADTVRVRPGALAPSTSSRALSIMAEAGAHTAVAHAVGADGTDGASDGANPSEKTAVRTGKKRASPSLYALLLRYQLPADLNMRRLALRTPPTSLNTAIPCIRPHVHVRTYAHTYTHVHTPWPVFQTLYLAGSGNALPRRYLGCTFRARCSGPVTRGPFPPRAA